MDYPLNTPHPPHLLRRSPSCLLILDSSSMWAITVSSAGLLGGPLTARRPASVARAHLRAVATSPELPTSERTQVAKERLHVRIDDEWYDLTNWRMAHPAGAHWIDAYKDSDATEVMYGFHSDKGMSMIKRLPRSKAPPVDVPAPVESSYAFRELRAKLVADGWYKPHWRGELQKLMPWAATLWIAKTLSMRSGGLAAFGAIFAYAVSNTLSGWLSHDYVHGRSPFCMAMRGFGELVGGMSTTWWSMKHNMHHALTNEVPPQPYPNPYPNPNPSSNPNSAAPQIGYDEDVALEPALYLWQPDPKNDSPMRKFQHLYWPIPFSVLFLYWRCAPQANKGPLRGAASRGWGEANERPLRTSPYAVAPTAPHGVSPRPTASHRAPRRLTAPHGVSPR